MLGFLTNQMDYIYFSTSLAFLILAVVCLTAGNADSRSRRLPWIWLGLFALAQGVYLGLELTSFSYFEETHSEKICAVVLAGSFILLIEFGRAGMVNILGRGPERWVHLPLLALLALCQFVELCQFKASSLLVLGLTAGIWAALTLYLFSSAEKNPAGRRALITVGIAVALYTVITVLTLNNGPFLLAGNQGGWVTVLVRLFLGLLAAYAALTVWVYLLAGNYSAPKQVSRKYFLCVFALFLVILATGWLVAELAGSKGEAEARHKLLSRSLTAAAAVDASKVAELHGSRADLPRKEYIYLQEQLRSIKQVNKDCRFVYLLGQQDGEVIFLVDAEPAQSIDFSAPGDSYDDSSPELRTIFSTGQPTVEGPLRDQWGFWVSGLAAISDPDSNLVIAVLGMDVDANDWQRSIAVYRMASFFIITIICLIIFGFIIALQLSREAALRIAASESRFRAVYESAPEAIVICDTCTGRILGANPAMSGWTGYNRNELYKLDFEDLFEPGTMWQDANAENLKSGLTVPCLYRKKDGTQVDADMTGSGLMYRGRECILVFVHDVTERRHRERVLLQQSSAIGASTDGIAIVDEFAKYTFVNEAHAKIYGYDRPEDLLGESWGVLYEQQELDWFEQEVIPEFLARGYWRGEAMGKKRDGSKFPQEVSLSRIDGGGLVCIVRDITERKLAQDKIEYLAYYDALTGLPNRTLFKNLLALALAQASRRQQVLAIMYLDLDRFKLTNDTLGHSVGDKLLQLVAERLSATMREEDIIARLGGDEFLVLLPGIINLEGAARVAQRIIEVLQVPFKLNGHELYINTSIGIAIYPGDGEDAEALLKNADIAMYQAKERGGSKYRFYAPAMNARALERLVLQNSLTQALKRNEFVLYYQPQVDAQTGLVIGTEALVRWQHPDLGLVPPQEFIPLAEETGLIVPLGEWVLETACAQNKAWQEAGHRPLRVAVNLSARQFQRRDLVGTVVRVLKKTGLEPRWLGLELTEGILIKDMDYTIAVLQELREMGIHIYIDDFGTGYSSLTYLKRFPVDKIKIDRSFISDIGSNKSSDTVIVTTIIYLARQLQLMVIAEGVETQDQLAFLIEHGCYEMQGYLFGKPVPATELEMVLCQQGYDIIPRNMVS